METEEKVIEILEFENKETTKGKPYVRFNTSEGWLSSFDGKANEELKKLKGKKAKVKIKTSGDFKNIAGFIEESEEEVKVKTEKISDVKIKREFPSPLIKNLKCFFSFLYHFNSYIHQFKKFFICYFVVKFLLAYSSN